MHVLIYEPYYQGHRLHNAARMLPALLSLGDSLTRITLVTSRAAPASTEYRTHIQEWEGRITIDAIEPELPELGLGAARQSANAFISSVRRLRPDHVYIPNADGMAQVMGAAWLRGRRRLPAGVPIEILLLRGAFAYPQPDWRAAAKARLSWELAMRGPWARIFHLDPMVWQALKPRRRQRVHLMPEPMEPPHILSKAEGRLALGIPTDGRYVGLAGMMDERKGADLLIRAFAAADLAASDRLLLVGQQSPGVRALLAGPFASYVRQGRILSIDRYVENRELDASIAAMDLVAAAYPRHIGSASIVIRAARASRPVLGSEFGWVGYIISRFGLGSTLNVSDIPAFARALRRDLDAAADFRVPPAGQRFLEFHTPENYGAVWTQLLRQRLRLPADARTCTWESLGSASET